MYALLMLLPQSEAFKTLHARLHSVPTVTLLKMDGQPPAQGLSPKEAAPRRSQDFPTDHRCDIPAFTDFVRPAQTPLLVVGLHVQVLLCLLTMA